MENFNVKKTVWGICLVILAVTLGIGSCYTVDTGEQAVVLRMGKMKEVTSEGLNFKMPFIDDVTKMSVRDNRVEVDLEVSSKDIQSIRVEVTLVYALETSMIQSIYQQYKTNIENTVIRPTLLEKINAIIAEYPIEEFVEKRPEIANRIKQSLSTQIVADGVNIKQILMTNHDFSDEFNKAIEDKKVAEQGALTAKFTLDRMKTEAEAQKLKQVSLSPLVLQEMAINKWDGKLPQYMSGDTKLPFMTLNVR